MFYVSSISGNKIGVTDSKDNIEEFYTNDEICDFIKNKKVDIYGTSYYNYQCDPTPLVINQALKESQLRELLNGWKKLHNRWEGHKVEDYLACAKVGTKIIVDYSYVGDGDRRLHSCTTVIEKLSYDDWHFEDSSNTASGNRGSSRFAAWCLEVACVHGKPKSIVIL